MSHRVAHRFTAHARTTDCVRCLDAIDARAGSWVAAEPDNASRWVCDRCARRDADGYAALLAWRRMAAQPTGRAAA